MHDLMPSRAQAQWEDSHLNLAEFPKNYKTRPLPMRRGARKKPFCAKSSETQTD
jgi:hypothetical protein